MWPLNKDEFPEEKLPRSKNDIAVCCKNVELSVFIPKDVYSLDEGRGGIPCELPTVVDLRELKEKKRKEMENDRKKKKRFKGL
jgi:hypothetical protein